MTDPDGPDAAGHHERKVLSAIIEFKTELDKAPFWPSSKKSEADRYGAERGVVSRCPADTIPHEAVVARAGYKLVPNGKTDLGPGRRCWEAAS